MIQPLSSKTAPSVVPLSSNKPDTINSIWNTIANYGKKAVGVAKTVATIPLDLTIGGVKGGVHTLVNASELGMQALNAMPFVGNNPTIPGSMSAMETLKSNAQPTNTTQKVGYTGEQIGEFLAPETKVSQLSNASKVAKAVKYGVGVGTDVAVAGVQSGGDTGTMVTTGALSGTAPIVAKAGGSIVSFLNETLPKRIVSNLLPKMKLEEINKVKNTSYIDSQIASLDNEVKRGQATADEILPQKTRLQAAKNKIQTTMAQTILNKKLKPVNEMLAESQEASLKANELIHESLFDMDDEYADEIQHETENLFKPEDRAKRAAVGLKVPQIAPGAQKAFEIKQGILDTLNEKAAGLDMSEDEIFTKLKKIVPDKDTVAIIDKIQKPSPLDPLMPSEVNTLRSALDQANTTKYKRAMEATGQTTDVISFVQDYLRKVVRQDLSGTENPGVAYEAFDTVQKEMSLQKNLKALMEKGRKGTDPVTVGEMTVMAGGAGAVAYSTLGGNPFGLLGLGALVGPYGKKVLANPEQYPLLTSALLKSGKGLNAAKPAAKYVKPTTIVAGNSAINAITQ